MRLGSDQHFFHLAQVDDATVDLADLVLDDLIGAGAAFPGIYYQGQGPPEFL